MLQVEDLSHVGEENGKDQYEEPDGEYTDFISLNNNTITVLTKSDSGEGGVAELPFSPSDETIKSLESSLEEGDYSIDELATLLAAEKDGKNRSGAKSVIKDHMD